MSKPKIILADTDEKYLEPLVNKFMDELAGRIELEVISDAGYFKEYFSVPQKVDMLVVNQRMYYQELQKQNMKCICILTEQMERMEIENSSLHSIYKYNSMKEIFYEIIHNAGKELGIAERENIRTQVITVCSGIGGVGKTSIALSLSEYLAKNHRKVLFLSTESMQSFRHFFKNKEYLPKDACLLLKENSPIVHQKIKEFFRTETFDYLPPLSSVLTALNLPFSIYRNFILSVVESEEYEFIVVDTQTGYSDDLIDILQVSDYSIIPFLQDELSRDKNSFLLESMQCEEKDKYVFICNQYCKDQFNSLDGMNIAGYIDYEKEMKGKKLTELQGLQRLGYMFL